MEPINVDFIINNDRVKADSQKVKQDITGIDQTAEKSAKRVSQTVKRVYDSNVKEVDEYTQAVARSAKTTATMGNTAAATKPKFNGLQNSINQLSREAPAFAVSAQTGFLALSNNIPILADEIAKLKAQNQALVASGQKAVPVWRQVAKSLLSFGTVLSLGVTLITIYGKEIGQFFGRLFSGKKSVDALKESQEALNKAFESSDYQTAIKDVLSLETNIDLAKKGMIDAKDVVEQYNESLGKAAGSANSLNEVEEKLIANSDRYIQMMLYKSAAGLALDEAAIAAKEAAEEQLKLEEELEKVRERIAEQEAAGRTSKQAGRGGKSVYALLLQEEGDLERELDQLRKEGENAIDERNKIYKKLQERAASFGLDLFPDEDKSGSKAKGDNGLKARQRLLDRIAALDKEYARKRMEDDEAEVQALRDKFSKIRTLIERFNSTNPSISINIDQLDDIGEQAVNQLLFTQRQEADQARRKEAKERMDQERKEWAAQLEALRSYQVQRNDLIEEYQKLRQKLISKGLEEEARELDRQHKEELGKLDDAQLKKLNSYKELFKGVNGLSIKIGEQIIANAKKLIATQEMSAEAKAEILQKIAEAEAIIQNSKVEEILKVSNAFWDLGDSLIRLGEATDNDQLAGLGRAMGVLSGNVQNIGKLMDGTATTGDGVMAAMSSMVGLIDMVSSAAQQRAQAEERYYRNLLDFQESYNLGLNERIRLEGELNDNVFLDDKVSRVRAAFEALQDAQKKYSEAMNKLVDAQVVTGQETGVSGENVLIGTLLGSAAGGLIGGLFGKETRDVMGGLLENFPDIVNAAGKLNRELVESLMATGQLDENSKLILEEIIEWENAIEKAKEVINEVVAEMAGSLGNELKNDLVEAFKAGEDAAVAMGDTVSQVLENILADILFQQIFGETFAQLQDEVANAYLAGEGFSEVFAGFFAQAQGLTDDFNNALSSASEEAENFGFDIFNQDSEGAEGLKGAIRRELTEATASELTGLYRATFDVQKRHLRVSEEMMSSNRSNLRMTQTIMMSNAMIEQNTLNTVNQLKIAVGHLAKIKDNTKEQSGRDLGLS